jgi:NADH-quinone oxidoreductase subunit N
MIAGTFDAVIPALCVTLAGLVILLAEAFRSRGERMPMAPLALIGLAGAGVASILLWDRDATSFGVMRADNFALFVDLILVVVGVLTVVMSSQIVDRDHLPAAEYYATVLFAIAGMMLMVQATELLLLFLALETMSIAVYVLTGLRRDQQQSTEAAFKYFLLGAFASSFFLYGIAFLYGVSGTTELDRLGAVIAAQSMSGNPMILLGLGLLLVGFAFKVSAVPFHMWTPDAYEGAPAVITGFMSTGVKAAAVAAFVRVFLSALEPMITEWAPILWVVAAATMILGTVVGVAQTSLKRMLAYSSIAHAGYAFVALVAHNALGASSILYYLTAYSLMSLGSFAVVTVVAKQGDQRYAFSDYAGLGHTNPCLAAVMSLFMFALAGFPPTAGFAGKFYVFSAAAQSGYYNLALIGMLTSVVSVVYYARVVMTMYMQEPSGEQQIRRVSPTLVALLALTVLGTLYLGIFPGTVLRLAEQSVAFLF